MRIITRHSSVRLRQAALLALALLPPAGALGQEFSDAIGREVSVFNDLLNPVFPNGAVSREASVFNDLINPTEPIDAVSREVAIMKYTTAITSNATARGLPLDPELLLPDQLAELNMAPPQFDPEVWMPVHRKNVNMADPFVCDDSPNPLAEGFVLSEGYLLNIDEVTLDNCGSTWYRFTFVLPQDVSNASMLGLANVTQQGVAYVNGVQVSGTMNVPPCVPQPDPEDPCYAAQDTGNDGVDSFEVSILTSPTPDVFEAVDAELFIPGLNEVVFGVAGDASFFDPTGLEFQAYLFYNAAARCSGDIDGDDDVDLDDFAMFIPCFAGVDVPISPECAFADFDGDSDADLRDFAVFQLGFGQGCP